MVDYKRACEVLVELEGVEVVGVRLVERPRCGGCGGKKEVWSKGWKRMRLVDQPGFGQLVRLEWSKHR